jgi:hypothetical protein
MALVSFFMCAKTDEEARAAPTAPPSSSSRCAIYGAAQNRQRPAPYTVNMWDEYNKWKRDNPGSAGGGAARRPDRLAGDDPQEAASASELAYRPGDPAQPGRQEQPRAHLRIARTVRPAK